MTLTCAITEVSPDQVALECWRASVSTVCNPHRVPMMNRWLVKKFKNGLFYTCIFFIHFISNHQQKYRKGHVFSNPRTFLIKHQICYNFLRISRIPETTSHYPILCIPINFSSNIPYPGNFFREYPVSRKPLIGPHCFPMRLSSC